MRTLSRLIPFLLFALTCAPAVAQEKANPPLPRVLIVGDSIYGNLSRSVATELKDKAQVILARWEPDRMANSTTALHDLNRLLGYLDKEGKLLPREQRPVWDLIHVNFGLGDLVYRAPNMKSFRVMSIQAGGIRATPAGQYEANLDQIIRQLQDTGAKIVWASTTPIRASWSNIFEVGSEVAYNTIAAKVMARHGVPINDMHAYAKSRMDMNKPAAHGADPFNFDKAQMHEPVTDTIASELRIDFHRDAK